MLNAFDHLIFVTQDLDGTAAVFRDLGFAITERADAEPGATENRLVVFSDGSYVEIVRFVDPEMLLRHRFKALAAEGGWAEAVINVSGVEGKLDTLTAAGVPISPLRVVRKALKDGRHWQVAMSHLGRGVSSPLMPMLAEDHSPHHLRVPDDSTDHPNGARRIAAVTMVAPEGPPAGYAELFGRSAGPVFGFGDGREIRLLGADGQEDHLSRRGEGILSVSFAGADGTETVLTADAVFSQMV